MTKKRNNKNLFIRSLLCATLLAGLYAAFSFDGKISVYADETSVENTESVEIEVTAEETHTVSFNVTGNDAVKFDPVEVAHGTVYDLSTLLEGIDLSQYNYLISVNGKEANSITVLSDVTVDVTFRKKIFYTVTINGVDIQMEVGTKLDRPDDPTKDSTAEFDYIFDGWYNGDEKWNFDTDTVVKDGLNLVAKYREIKRKYTISFNIFGNDKLQIASIEMDYGEVFDLKNVLDSIDVAGYTYTITVGEEEKMNFKVLGDVKVYIKFDRVAEKLSRFDELKEKLGCSSTLGGGTVSALLIAAALGIVLKRKREE